MKALKKLLIILLSVSLLILSGCTNSNIEESDGMRFEVYDEEAAIVGYSGDAESVYFLPTFNGLPINHIVGEKDSAFSSTYTAKFKGEGLKRVYFSYQTKKAAYHTPTDGLSYEFEDGCTVICANTERYVPSARTVVPMQPFTLFWNSPSHPSVEPANVSFYFNHTGSPNGDYFFIDLIESTGKVTKPPYDPEREGYIFKGWYKDYECTIPWDFDTDVVEVRYDEAGKRIYEETRIYAKWISDGLFNYRIDNHYVTITSVNEHLATDNIVVPEKINGIAVKKIGERAFEGLDLKSVVLPKRLDEIGDYAFSSCENLSSITFASSSDLTKIGKYAFKDCKNLVDFDVPDGCLIVGDYAFSNTGIRRAYVNISLESFASTAFYGAPIEEYYQSATTGRYAVIDGALYDVRNHRLVAYPSHSAATEYTLPSDITVIHDYAFALAENLISVDLSSAVSIPDGAFFGCKKLKSIKADSVAFVGSDAFSGTAFINEDKEFISVGSVLVRCNTEGKTVTSDGYRRIHAGAFSTAPNLESVILSGVEAIEDGAFLGCKSLKTVYIKSGALVKLNENTFPMDSIETVYVAAIKYDRYIANDTAGLFTDILAKHVTTLIFDSNGGEALPNGKAEYYSYLLLPTPKNPGHSFLGWSYQRGDETVTVKNGDTWLSIEDTVTLVAIWK